MVRRSGPSFYQNIAAVISEQTLKILFIDQDVRVLINDGP